jgi:FAD/FMN-containing dehydrogenase
MLPKLYVSTSFYILGKLILSQIKLATMHNIPFLATGTRHGYTTTLGELHNGLAIDLSHFKEFELDADAKTLTVGPGVTVGEIFDPLFSAGFEIRE